MVIMTENREGCEFRKRLFVAVHAGAGFHSQDRASDYKKLCRKACLKAMSILTKRESALKAVTAAVCVLEDSELTNAGRGSNLTVTGSVECDACVMEGTTSLFGAVGCLSGVLNPIKIAAHLLEMQQQPSLSLGRISPSVLAGEGARDWAKEQGFPCNSQSKLLTDKAQRLYLKYKRKVERAESHRNAKKVRLTDAKWTNPVATEPTQGENAGIEARKMCRDRSAENDEHKDDQEVDDTACEEKAMVQDSVEDDRCKSDPELDSTTAESKTLLQDTEKGERCKDDPELDSTSADFKTWVQDTVRNNTHEGDSEWNGTTADERTLVQDTVGAVCIDWEGHVISAVSSGGIWLKQSGRLGPAAMYGAACWAEDSEENRPGVAVIASGCGEHLMRTLLAKSCADCLQSAEGTSEGLSHCFKKYFLESRLLRGVESRQAGAVAVMMTSTDEGIPEFDICWGHTTDSMAVGYMTGSCNAPKTVISRLNKGCHPGRSFVMSGDFFSSADS